MTVMRLEGPLVPKILSGPVCVGRFSAPRFFATIWCDLLKKDRADKTKASALRAIDQMYVSVERQRGADRLDRMLADLAFDEIEDAMMGFLAELQADSDARSVNNAGMWEAATGFIIDILDRSGVPGTEKANEIRTRLYRIEALRKSLSPGRKAANKRVVRALPAAVVEDLFVLFDPLSSRNPFFSEEGRFRNVTIHNSLLDLGFRRGEGGLLLTDSAVVEFDLSKGRNVAWVNVTNVDDEQERNELSIKNGYSIRQVPTSEAIATHLLSYAANWRGRRNHRFLFVSRLGKPIGARTINNIYDLVSKHLSPAAKAALARYGKTKVSPHDMRHTCAVVRLNRHRQDGHDTEEAEGMLREYFGWAPGSDMPQHYTRAYYEGRLQHVAGEMFDDYVSALRSIGL